MTVRTGADVWMEVKTHEGRFFIPFDASVFDLVQLVIKGGYVIEEHTALTGLEHRQGVGRLGGGAGIHR